MPPERSSSNAPMGGGPFLHTIPHILPHERVFPIQIGSELFKLSGASLSSDAPSYFSQYFLCQLEKQKENNGTTEATTTMRTLYIDRDPLTFRDISLHLQGYHVSPRDGTHFVRLFADAQFYSLPRLISQLYEESIFMSIGHREFQIPRHLFSDPGNTPNFFSLGFAIFFTNPDEIFPGLSRQGLIRPPSILPPSVPGRSADTFAELLHLLRGYPVHIRDNEHRASLLRDCRYFNFKGLEQRLIPHAITFNQARHREEIVLRLQDILKSGISVLPDPAPPPPPPGTDPAAAPATSGGWVNYARPFVDEKPFELVLEIGDENMRLHFLPGSPSSSSADSSSSSSSPTSPALLTATTTTREETRVEFFRDARARITKLFEVIASKLALPPTTQPLGLLMAAGKSASSQPATPANTPLSEDDWVKCVLKPETSITLDGRPYTGHIVSSSSYTAAAGSSAARAAAATAAMVQPPFHHNTTGTAPHNGNMTGSMDDHHSHLPENQQQQQQHLMAGGSSSGPTECPNNNSSSNNNNTGGFSNVPSVFLLNPHNPNNLHHLPPPPRKRKRPEDDIGLGPSSACSTSSPSVSVVGRGNGNGNGNSGGGPLPLPSSSPAPRFWIIKTGQWRLRIRRSTTTTPGRTSGVECYLYAVKLDAMSGEWARNEARGFLKG